MIVFSDMDGTLLTSDKQMSDAAWAMLDELARRGIEFVPCTCLLYTSDAADEL